MDLNIKKLDRDEFAVAKDLFIWFQEDDGDAEVFVPSDNYLRSLLSKDDFHLVVAFDGNKIIGGLTAYELPMYKKEVNEIFLYEIGVEPDYRRKNVGAELITFLKKIASERGIPEMYVGTEMDNIPAQKLYARTGGKFQKIAWYVYDLG